MSSLDAVFLAVEDEHNPMNIGSVGIFEGPMPPFESVMAHLDTRVPTIRRCRQRVRMPVGPVGRPLWIPDANFDIGSHVLRHRLSESANETLETFVGDMIATPLDRARPLWEVWIVDGMPCGRWALVAKVHHCMVDGIAGSDLLSGLLAGDAHDGSTRPPDVRDATGPPTRSVVFWFGVRAAVLSLSARARGAATVLVHPRRSWRRGRQIVIAARRLWTQPPHRETSLVGPIGRTRRWVGLSVPTVRAESIRESLGGSLNDLILAAATIGFRGLLTARGEPVDGRTITAMVPVSLRTAAERGRTGNRVANVHAPLPVGSDDPATIHRAVRVTLDELKTSHETEATGLLLRIGDYVPRLVADRASRTVLHRQRDVETVITNVPGPRGPLSLLGHTMVEGFPVAPIGGRVRITVAVWSYCDTLAFGITGDGESATDIGVLARGIADGFVRLLGSPGP